MCRMVAVLVAFIASAAPAYAQCPNFTVANYTIPGKPRAVVAADFNRDGIADLLVGLDESSGNVMFFPGNADGTFGSPVSTATTIPFVWAMAAGDFNRDGKLDVAVTNEATVLAILLGNGDGTFSVNRFTVSEADDLYGLTVADFNGDGRTDLAMGISTSVSILLNKGDGTFAPEVQYPTGITPIAIAAADLSLDGKADVVTTNQSTSSVSVLLGKGDGTFDHPTTSSVGTTPWGIAIGRFNGRPGVAVPNWGSNSVSVLVNDCALPKKRAVRH